MKLDELEQLQLHNSFLQQQLLQSNMKILQRDYSELEKMLLDEKQSYQTLFEKACESHGLDKDKTQINPITGDIKTEIKTEVENAV
jgi:hypothetical protein